MPKIEATNLRAAVVQVVGIGAYLGGADLGGADLGGAKACWQSHDMIAELLRRASGNDIEKLKVAGLILIKRDWCWRDFIGLSDPLKEWALDVLSALVTEGDSAPAILHERKVAKDAASSAPNTTEVPS